MTYEEYITLYGGSNYSQLRQWARSDSAFRSATTSLHKAVYGAPLAVSCSDCIADAALNLIKKHKTNTHKMESRYKLKSGAIILRDVRNVNDSTRMATRFNLTDDLAKYHLYTNPSCVKYFATLPKDWEKEVAEYGVELDGITTEVEGEPIVEAEPEVVTEEPTEVEGEPKAKGKTKK